MRACLPLTTLNQELVENAFLPESVRHELLINETEHKMIHGSVPRWGGWPTPGSPSSSHSLRNFMEAYGMNQANYSALEQRVVDSLITNKAVLNVPRGTGKTMLWQHMMQKLAELGKLPRLITTDAEISRGFPSSCWKEQTPKSAPIDIGSYVVRDAIVTAKHYLDQHAYDVHWADYGEAAFAEHVMQKNRQFVLNFDQLGGGKCDSRNSTGARHLAGTRTTSSWRHQQHWPSRTFLRSTASSST